MPKVIIEYNVFPECVVRRHGVWPCKRRERDRWNRPLGDEVVATLTAMLPRLTFEARWAEWKFRCPTPLLRVGRETEAVNEAEATAIAEHLHFLNTEASLIIAAEPELSQLMSLTDREVLRRLSRMRLADTNSILRVLDEVLLAIDAVRSLADVDILVLLHETVDGGETCPAATGDGSAVVGFRVSLRVPATVGLVVHEAGHVLESMRGRWR